MLKKCVLPIALVVFLLPVGISIWQVLSFTHGILSYPFDDAFIHLAIAKNIAFHGVWGISPHAFSSASSSVLYPLLLAGCLKVFGVWTGFPLLINVLAGVILIVVVRRWLEKEGISTIGQLLTLLAFILLTPLPAVAFFGMEHTLQILFDFLFIYSFSEAWGEKQELNWQVYVYGALVMAVRYEGMFLIAMACLVIVLLKFSIKNISNAILLGVVSFLPVITFGVYSMSKGELFVPNSVLAKSTTPELSAQGILQWLTSDFFNQLYFVHPTVGGMAIHRLLLLLPFCYLIFWKSISNSPIYRYILLILTGMVILHLLFARTDILYRYEAYLIACSIPILGVLADKYGASLLKTHLPKAAWVAAGLAILISIPIVLRSKACFGLMTQGAINIYEQQYQMGQFVHRYYDETPIAIGDIGAISFFAHAQNVDLEGLANLPIAKARKYGYRTPDFLYNESKKDGAKLAIVFDRAYHPFLLNRWYKIATWQIPNNVACYSDVVSFYAIDSVDGLALLTNLKAFQPSLPRDVMVRYRN